MTWGNKDLWSGGACRETNSFRTFKPKTWWNLHQNGMEMMSHLERSGSKAGSLDGITDAKSQHWRDLVARGFSPTSLGTYSQCPMHYWMTHVLKIQGAKDSISKELPGRVWGEIVHHILCNVYQDLFKHG